MLTVSVCPSLRLVCKKRTPFKETFSWIAILFVDIDFGVNDGP